MDRQQYRIDLSYIGTQFHGWQSQPSGLTIQDHLERALSQVLRQDRVIVVGSSRTDTGVHARQQVACFRHGDDIDLVRLQLALHGLLPETIGIRSIVPVASKFHPIHSVESKYYCYRLIMGRVRDPFIEPFVYHGPRELNIEAMRRASMHLVGTHDFTSFCAADSSALVKIRTVLSIDIIAKDALLELWFHGEGFLKQMIRTIVGTLLEVGTGKRDADTLPTLLAAMDRRSAGMAVPGKGLTLERIEFLK